MSTNDGTGDAEEAARRLRGRLQELHRRQRRETPAIEGVSPGSARVLGAVARVAQASAGARARPGEIAAELGMQRSNVATALRELEAVGLIARESDADDRRGVLVALTAAGERAVTAHRNGRDTWFAAAIAAALTPEEQARLFAAGELIERVARHDGGAA